MKVLIIGAGSRVGEELVKLLTARGIECITPTDTQVNAREPLALAKFITQASPAQVVNLSAFAAGRQEAVFLAEQSPDDVDLLNHQLPELVAQVCDHLHLPLIQLSSVFVFGGDKKLAYNEQDPAKPIGLYGKAFAAGEQAIQSTTKQHVIVRAGWLFGTGQDDMLRDWVTELKERDGAVTVCRRKFAPTPVEDLARVLQAIVLQVDCGADVWGTYHYAALEPLRENEFVQQLVRFAAQHDEAIYRLLDHVDIQQQKVELPQIANATLASKKIFETFGIKQRPWQGALQKLVKSWYTKSATKSANTSTSSGTSTSADKSSAHG